MITLEQFRDDMIVGLIARNRTDPDHDPMMVMQLNEERSNVVYLRRKDRTDISYFDDKYEGRFIAFGPQLDNRLKFSVGLFVGTPGQEGHNTNHVLEVDEVSTRLVFMLYDYLLSGRMPDVLHYKKG